MTILIYQQRPWLRNPSRSNQRSIVEKESQSSKALPAISVTRLIDLRFLRLRATLLVTDKGRR
ncbi:hypothetical protein Prudu_018660 [Prunus dulcis]|uniref:Uncharacterized protein n=1 Tax=Prunus dulcis TaxID=3755 RepID=A0A4Y1RR97_PRUDU|nr:hypothetical protein Prudu_018660 [Prunus dulcis]